MIFPRFIHYKGDDTVSTFVFQKDGKTILQSSNIIRKKNLQEIASYDDKNVMVIHIDAAKDEIRVSLNSLAK